MSVEQYAVVLINLDPTIGSEIKKTRPCLIISPIEMNQHLRTIVIAPLTTTMRKYPSRVKVHFSDKEGMIALDQIRTIDKQRIIKTLGGIKPSEIKNVKEVLMETYVR
ncbi:MAG: type II toxin-antitoxin system PemK/MazF family toxin [Flavobacteriales bacterium]|nr:type II toxin-antitoxin system PemK/MazF family toxin [Flavobacteriales bacterium]